MEAKHIRKYNLIPAQRKKRAGLVGRPNWPSQKPSHCRIVTKQHGQAEEKTLRDTATKQRG